MSTHVTLPRESAAGAIKTARIPVTGMTCAACQSFVQRTLSTKPGVKDVTVNLMLHNATVSYDPEITSPGELVEKIRDIGYGAELPQPEVSVIDLQEKDEEEELYK